MRKFFAALLASAMLFTLSAVPISATHDRSTTIAAYGNISFAELIRAIVVAHDGKEQPPLMDTHYAAPYILRAVELGILAEDQAKDFDFAAWNADASRETMSSVLDATAKLKDADMAKITAAVNALLVNKIVVNGKEIKADISHMNGSIMLPVRAISEALGFVVTWDSQTYTANINTGKIQSNVTIGENSYYYSSVNAIGMSKPSPMSSAPILRDNKTLVPLDFFNLISTATSENGTITISAK